MRPCSHDYLKPRSQFRVVGVGASGNKAERRNVGTQESVMTGEHILILTTGGTIDKEYFDALSRYQITDTMVSKMLTVARVTHPYTVQEVMRKDSIDMTDEDRSLIVERVASASATRIIITHGTDSITKTALALSKCRHKIIVLTGALAPARFSESDAAFNLGMAFAAVQTASAGVYIAINGSVFRGDEIVKNRELGRFVRIDDLQT
jgi:L-asparaginase